MCILTVYTVSSFDGVVWPPAKYTNDDFSVVWLSCCLHMLLDQSGCAHSAAVMIAHQEPREDSLYRGCILMFIYTMANKMCAPQQDKAE